MLCLTCPHMFTEGFLSGARPRAAGFFLRSRSVKGWGFRITKVTQRQSVCITDSRTSPEATETGPGHGGMSFAQIPRAFQRMFFEMHE